MKGEISYEMTFDAGHRIVGHKGKCARLHGHTYRVLIKAWGSIHEPGFVVDFGDLKDIVNEWDHRMLLWDQDPVVLGQKADTYHPANEYFKEDDGIVRVPFNPTAEYMAQNLAERFYEDFGLTAVDVTLWETPKCSARYTVVT